MDKIVKESKKANFSLDYAQAKNSNEKCKVLLSTGCSAKSNSYDWAKDIGTSFNVDDLNNYFLSIHSSSTTSLPIVNTIQPTNSFEIGNFSSSEVLENIEKY